MSLATSTAHSVHGEISDEWLDLSTKFVLSAGTVTIDPSAPRQILLLLHNKTREHLLPKGRKDIGETLSEAAVRETYEETGYACSIISHTLPTKATRGLNTKNGDAHSEPIACQQRLTKRGVRKIIFWYVAVGDSNAVKADGTQDVGEDFTSLWVEADRGMDLLTFEDDKQIVRLALQVIESGPVENEI